MALVAMTTFNLARSQQNSATPTMQTDKKNWGLVIHGGAGTIDRAKMTPEALEKLVPQKMFEGNKPKTKRSAALNVMRT